MAPKSSDKTTAQPTPKEPKQENKDKKNAEPELSEEDAALKERLDTCVSTLLSTETNVTVPLRLKSLEIIVDELRSATSSMTSVPKPLKFLRGHWDVLKGYYGGLTESKEGDALFLKARLGDVLAVLAMTMGNRGEFV
jgi:26S proteasome regulatory subunit N1